MFKIKKGAEIGAHGSTEMEFEKVVNFLKNAVECVEVSRTGQASDRSLAVELRYRDFPTFILQMDSSSYMKGKIAKIGENVPNLLNMTGTQTTLDVALTENLFLAWGPSSGSFGMVKNNIGEYFWFSNASLSSCRAGQASSSKPLKLFPKCVSTTGKVIVLDIFCPDFSMTAVTDTIDFEKKLLNFKNISGIGEYTGLLRFSVDGQEYIRVTHDLCIEVTP